MTTLSADTELAPESQSSGRTLVLCFDGTNDKYDAQNTNVVKFFSLLEKCRRGDQLCYYQPGVGTYFQPGVVSPIWEWFAKVADEALAWYLYAHVTDGYRFLMDTYQEGDRICLFGFSRGAYTARALAGLVHKIGILPRHNDQLIPFIFKLYTRTKKQDLLIAAGFKRTFSRDVKIDFVGVWDTVASVGVIMGRTLPFTTTNTTVKTFRQALSLDERRVKFKPSLVHRPAPNQAAAKMDPNAASDQSTRGIFSDVKGVGTTKNPTGMDWSPPREEDDGGRRGTRQDSHGSDVDMPLGAAVPNAGPAPQSFETDALEVWFSGCHSDVGGGAVPDATARSLSDITLRWMVRQVTTAQCGIVFNTQALKELDISLEIFPPPTKTRAGQRELALDSEDARMPKHDELKKLPLWWILEVLPSTVSYQDNTGVWRRKLCINLGRGRDIPYEKPKFHISVQERMNDAKLKYKPKAKWKGEVEYVQ